MTGLSGMLVGLLASVVGVPSQDLTFENRLAYFSGQPSGRVVVYYQGGTECKGERCCGETVELFAEFADTAYLL